MGRHARDAATQDIPGLLLFCDEVLERNAMEKARQITDEKPSVMDKLKESRQSPGQTGRGKKAGRNEPEL